MCDLADLEARIALERLFTGYPHLSLATADLPRVRSMFTRAWAHLPVALDQGLTIRGGGART
ncbi:hypothetical protein ABZ801_15895 [Actinomadura sp. NPDC047616]|uniref:hypothetical protein n=1 Tax=Actinomadura sp. NPDC047616 TaxID=3155914 RepID=UPI00340CD695